MLRTTLRLSVFTLIVAMSLTVAASPKSGLRVLDLNVENEELVLVYDYDGGIGKNIAHCLPLANIRNINGVDMLNTEMTAGFLRAHVRNQFLTHRARGGEVYKHSYTDEGPLGVIHLEFGSRNDVLILFRRGGELC